MNNIWNIAKKELLRFFTDKRMVFSSILLPGLMIYVMYSFMGNAFSTMFSPEDSPASVLSINMPVSVEAIVSMPESNLSIVPVTDQDAALKQIEAGEAEVFVIFPEDFEETIAVYQSQSGTAAPDITMYYNSSETSSNQAYGTLTTLLDNYESAFSNKFDINREIPNFDLAANDLNSGMQVMSSMLPLLLTIFMFSACMAIVPESIAGEKERGTIATLLVTPLSRTHLVIGKVLAMGIIALCSGISSFIGTFLSLPKLMGASEESSNFFEMYSPIDFVMLLLVIFSTILLLVSMVSILSAFAKSVKEAATYVAPMMVVVMLIGITSMFSQTIPTNIAIYFIPLYNSVQSMNGIFSVDYIFTNVLVTVLSNLAYTSLCVVIISRMFHNEKIVFSR